MTIRDVIKGSLRLLGVVASGEEPTAEEMQDALDALNAMLDSWASERLFVYSVTPHKYNLTPGKQTYTLGAGGDFDQPRPVNIDQAYVLYPSNGVGDPVVIPLNLLSTDEWAALPLKGLTSTFPTSLYNGGEMPNAMLSFWPVPTQTVPVQLWTWDTLGNFDATNLSDDLSLPPGYARTIRYNLAVELAPEFEREVSTAVATIATESKLNVKIQNAPELPMSTGMAGRGGWNRLTGERQ